MEKEEILKEKLEKLSKCKGLSQEELQGRYKNAYQRLKGEIRQIAEEILHEIATGYFMWSDIDYMAAVKEINDFVEQPAGKTIMNNISHALFKNCSYEEFNEECLKMRELVTHVFFKYALQKRENV